MKTLVSVLFAMTLSSCAAHGQTGGEFNKDAEKKFSVAVKDFSRGEYARAIVNFEELVQLPAHQRTTAAYIMLGKSYLETGQLREAVKTLRDFLDSFPESYYVDDAYYTLALTYEAQRRYDDALLQYVNALETTDHPRIQSRSSLAIENLVKEKLDLQTLIELQAEVRNPDSRDFLSVKVAEKQLDGGNILAAEQALEPVLGREPASKHVSLARELLERIHQGVNVKIGVLLPIMNRSSQKNLKLYGEEFLQGMRFALDDLRASQKSSVDIALEVRDTERDPILAARLTEELANDKSVVAILGPVFNNEALACAGIANSLEVPLITPTANQDGIAAIGPYVFQCNPNMTSHGRAAAQYAVSVLGLRTLATVAPSEGPGKSMAAAFTQEALLLGARVVATEWYPPGATDLRDQLSRVRRAAFLEAEPLVSFAGRITPEDVMRIVAAGVSPHTVDSLMGRSAEVSVYALFGADGKRVADSLQLPMFTRQKNVDSLDMPATGIQAIYLPINSPEEIVVLASQIAYYNITAQLIGSHDWYSLTDLDASRRYVDGVMICSDFYVDNSDPTFTAFASRWTDVMKHRPGPNGVLGYDVMNLVASIVLGGATSRAVLTQALSNVESTITLHNLVTLKPDRVNSELLMLQYKDGTVKKIGSISVP